MRQGRNSQPIKRKLANVIKYFEFFFFFEYSLTIATVFQVKISVVQFYYYFQVQLEIIKHLYQIAVQLGPEKTREELLPLIKENLDLHDEFLLNFSEQLEGFIPLVGGYEHSQTVLDVLVKLCSTDEPIVRDRAVLSMKKIVDDMSQEQIESIFLPNLETLVVDNWFTSKCSAASLYPVSIFNGTYNVFRLVLSSKLYHALIALKNGKNTHTMSIVRFTAITIS